MTKVLNKGDIIYYARIIPSSGVFDVADLKIRTIENTYFVGVDKHNKRAHLLPYSAIGQYVFYDRDECLEYVWAAEAHSNESMNEDTYYEEY